MPKPPEIRTSDSPRGQSRDTARHFRKLYVIALSLIAVLAIVGQVLIQRSLGNQQSGSHVVNKAGYQRMLSQRIAMKMLIHDPRQPDSRADVRAIEALRQHWVTAHEELVRHVDEIAAGEAARATLHQLLANVHAPQQRISAAVDRLADEGALSADDRAAILQDQDIFLPLMDATVLAFEHSVRTRIRFLQGVEFGLMLATLVVLALEAALIFRPAVQRLQLSLEQLEQRNRQAAGRLQSLRHLAGGIAHNFNNILTSVLGHAELQRMDAVHARQNTEYIDAQIRGCQRAAGIVSELLKYSGHGPFHLEPTSLGPWLREMNWTFASASSPVPVEFDVTEDDATVNVDRNAIAQAVEGLVANAIEAMTNRSVCIIVRLLQVSLTEPRTMAGPYRTELPAGLYACIRVIDGGEGIPAEELEHIFNPYHTRRQFGRGLGLAAILGIAHGHGGGIDVQSRVGVGSTVSLYLPLVDAGATAAVTPVGNR